MTFALQATATGRGADRRLSPVVHIQTDGIRRAKLIHGTVQIPSFITVLYSTEVDNEQYCTVLYSSTLAL